MKSKKKSKGRSKLFESHDDVNKIKETLENDDKNVIFITGRVHPGESVSSYIVDGLIRFLVFANKASLKNDSSDTSNEKSPQSPYSADAIRTAKYLRKKFIFVIIPMLNPDGVIAGHYRSSFAGHDLNKVFLFPNEKLHPVIFHLKSMISQ